MNSKAQIVATLGPSCTSEDVLSAMRKRGMDAVRLNFAWRGDGETKEQVEMIRRIAKQQGRTVVIIADLPGPRVQLAEGHTYDASLPFSLTQKDEEHIRFCIAEHITHDALSF